MIVVPRDIGKTRGLVIHALVASSQTQTPVQLVTPTRMDPRHVCTLLDIAEEEVQIGDDAGRATIMWRGHLTAERLAKMVMRARQPSLIWAL